MGFEKIEVNKSFHQFEVLVASKIEQVDLIEKVSSNSTTVIVVDGTFTMMQPPKGMAEISSERIGKEMICVKKYKNDSASNENTLTIIYLDHHKFPEFPNQVLQLNDLLDEVKKIVPENDDLILCTPRPDTDSVAALYRFWIEKSLKSFNKGKYSESLRLKRIEMFVNALESSAQWGDTFGFAENNFADFAKIELDDIRQVAKYLNRLEKTPDGLQKGLDTLQEIFENYLNRFRFELPLVQKREYWKMMAQEQKWIVEIQRLWSENHTSQEFYNQGLIYIDIYDLESFLKSKGLNSVIDAEIVCTAIFNLKLEKQIYPYIVIKRNRDTKPDLSYYSFGTLVEHENLDPFLNNSLGTKCLESLNLFENVKSGRSDGTYFSGRNIAAGTIKEGSSLTPKEVGSVIISTLESGNYQLKSPYKSNPKISNLGIFRRPVN